MPGTHSAEERTRIEKAFLEEWWESPRADEFRASKKRVLDDLTVNVELRDKLRAEMDKLKQKIQTNQEPPPVDTTEMNEYLQKRRPADSGG
jgi:cell division FtsZ-interacting protein ZapD